MRTLSLLAGLAALVVATGSALACEGAAHKVSGTFDAAGRFVLSGAWGEDGTPVANAKGMVLESFTTAENLVIPASTMAGKQVCLFGSLDATHRTMSVAGYRECPAGACDAKSASACGASGAAAKSASAAAAGAGSCAAKGASAKTAGAGCVAAEGASVRTADAKTAGADGCCAAKAAAAKSASASSCGAGEKAAGGKAAAASMLVYNVSGMTCGGCASKVESAVTKLAIPNVTGCTVDLEAHQATVTTTGDVDRDAIRNAITSAGFPAELAPVEATKS